MKHDKRSASLPFRIIIPARYHSQRLPGKPLLPIAGKPMLQHVYERAVDSGAVSVVIATDTDRVAEAASQFDAPVCMTHAQHKTGTDRAAEACRILGYAEDDIVVCLQCDEPMISPATIHHLAVHLARQKDIAVASVCSPLRSVDELFNPNITKVVIDRYHRALYFSRAPIPWQRDHFGKDRADITLHIPYYCHIGLYAYRVGFLDQYTDWVAAPIEEAECLEQLRILWNGSQIYLCQVNQHEAIGVDTPAGLERVRAHFAQVSV